MEKGTRSARELLEPMTGAQLRRTSQVSVRTALVPTVPQETDPVPRFQEAVPARFRLGGTYIFKALAENTRKRNFG